MLSSLPEVVVISLGGTIAMTQAGDGVVPVLKASDLVAAVPGLSELASITTVNFRQVPGASLRIDDLVDLATEIDRWFAKGVAGVVVTQGTDTIEETAYCLDLLIDRRGPVVVTGAMRNPTLPGADGPANLYAAVVVATSGVDLGGVVVVMEDQVYLAFTVTKTHSTLPSAFAAGSFGPVALVAEGKLIQLWMPAVRHRTVLPRTLADVHPSVPIVTIGLDEDGRALQPADHADAVVLDALGGGHVPEWLVEPIGNLAARVPVVMTSRTGNGPVLRDTYGFVGSERDLRKRGVLSAGLLNAVKVRILLLLLLRSGASRAEIEHQLRLIDGANVFWPVDS